MKQARIIGAAALAVALVAGLAAAPATAKVTPKDGVYQQSFGKAYAQLSVYKGKVSGAAASMKFKTGSGKACLPEDFSHDGDLTFAYWTAKKPLKLDGKGRFAVKNAAIEGTPSARISVSGKFKSRTKATFTIKVTTTSGCNGSITAKNPKYYAGG